MFNLQSKFKVNNAVGLDGRESSSNIQIPDALF